MSENKINSYLPDYLVTPGEVLEDYLESLAMTQAELAARTGLAKKTVNEIVKGKSPITTDTALKLERVLGRPAHFWNNLERDYQEGKTRLAEKVRMESHLEWLKKVPINTMVRLGWLRGYKDKVSQLEEVLRFFGVASPDQWRTVWQNHQVAYRQTRRFETHEESVSAWLRQGEILAQRIACEPFDKDRFQKVLDEIRHLTREGPEIFVPKLTELCASAGVALVFVPELPKTGVYGATRWMGDKAVIQLSLRYKSNDLLWFTLFHEAGHILKHGHRDIFIEGKDLDDAKEEEANTFARDRLISPAAFRRFARNGRITLAAVKRFADEIGIAPGIVVGRLQHEGLMHRNTGNGLKIFYRWAGQGEK